MSIKKIIIATILVLFTANSWAGIIYQNNFDSESSTCWNGTAQWRNCGDFKSIGNYLNMSLSTTHKRSGAYAARMHQRWNEERAQAYINLVSPLSHTSGYSELYVQQWNYFTGTDGTYDHAVQPKGYRVTSSDGSTVRVDVVGQICDNNQDRDNEYVKFCANDTYSNPWGCMSFNYVFPDNTWVGTEYRVKLNTPGLSDGVVEFWTSTDGINWTKRGSRTGINIQDSSNWKLNSVLVGGWYSDATSVGGEGGSDQDNYRYIDDLIISTTPILSGGSSGNSAPSVNFITTSPKNITVDSLAVSGTASDSDGTVSGCKWRIGAVPGTSSGTVTSGTTSWSATTSGYSEGTNTLWVGCYDNDGDWAYDSIIVSYSIDSGINYATIGATDSSASESGLATGTFRVSISPVPTGDTTVNLTISGSATNGTDYNTISNTVVVGTGGYTDITLTPIQDTDIEGTELVTITLAAGTGYTVGSPSADTANITDDDTPSPWGEGTILGNNTASDYNGTEADTYINKGLPTSVAFGAPIFRLYTYPIAVAANVPILKWNIASVTGSVSSATLWLYMTDYDDTETNPYYVSVHKIVNNNPVLAEATWNEYSTGNSWSTDTILDNISAAEDTVAVGTVKGTWYSWDVTLMVAAWQNTPASNYGMALTSDISGHTQAVDEDRYFAGSLYEDSNYKPVLIITHGTSSSVSGGGTSSVTGLTVE